MHNTICSLVDTSLNKVIMIEKDNIGHLDILCHLRSIAAHRDNFVRHLFVCVCMRASVCPVVTFLVVTHSYVLACCNYFKYKINWSVDDSMLLLC